MKVTITPTTPEVLPFPKLMRSKNYPDCIIMATKREFGMIEGMYLTPSHPSYPSGYSQTLSAEAFTDFHGTLTIEQ